MALLKLEIVVASLTSFPWKQPAGQLVPINLSSDGASVPDRPQELASLHRVYGGGVWGRLLLFAIGG